MRLHATVERFSTEIFSDATAPTTTFHGKLLPFPDVTNSGVAAHRRILEVAPAVIIPSSNVVNSPSSESFIVGYKTIDFWEATEIRNKYSVLPSSGIGIVRTIGETLAGSGGNTNVYSFPFFVKGESVEEDISDKLTGYTFYFSSALSFVRGDVVSLEGSYYRLQTDTWVDAAGFLVAHAIKVEDPVQIFTVQSGSPSYNATTDSYPLTPTADVTCFVETLSKDYEFVTPSYTKIEAGDKAISLLESDVSDLVAGNFIGDYQVIAIRDQGTWVTAQCRLIP